MCISNWHNMHDSTPVLVIAFLRKDNVLQIVKTLLESKCGRIYVSIDGGRTSKETESQKLLIQELDELSKNSGINMYVNHYSTNFGVALGVIKAIDWFFEHETSGVIIEDDLVFDSNFINFCEKGLKKFGNFSEILMICGTQPFEREEFRNEIQFVNYPMIWGWATWRNKWEIMREFILDSNITKGKWKFPHAHYWKVGVRRVQSGIVDTWDIPLAASMRRLSLIAALPPANLVKNIGYDSFGTHTAGICWPLNMETKEIDTVNLFLSDSLVKVNGHLNKDIEKKLMKIRFRHYFIGIYDPIIRILKSKRLSIQLNTLKLNYLSAHSSNPKKQIIGSQY